MIKRTKTTTTKTTITTTKFATKAKEQTTTLDTTQALIVENENIDRLTNVSTACSDLTISCFAWKLGGYCKTHTDWMRLNCPTACDQCKTEKCIDKDKFCLIRKNYGHCESFAYEMSEKCPRSCDLCRGLFSIESFNYSQNSN